MLAMKTRAGGSKQRMSEAIAPPTISVVILAGNKKKSWQRRRIRGRGNSPASSARNRGHPRAQDKSWV